jgi:hypothetical protein
MSINAAMFLAVYAFLKRPAFRHTLAEHIPVMAYDIACLIWLISFLRPREETRKGPEVIPPELVQEAKEAKAEIRDWLAGKKHSSE